MRKELDRSAARRRMESLDAGVVGASCWRALRRFLVFVALLAALVELGGVPHLRITYTEQGDRIRSARYWSVTGSRTLVAGDVAPTCPLIALVPTETSLVSVAAAALGLEN